MGKVNNTSNVSLKFYRCRIFGTCEHIAHPKRDSTQSTWILLNKRRTHNECPGVLFDGVQVLWPLSDVIALYLTVAAITMRVHKTLVPTYHHFLLLLNRAFRS